VQSKYHQSRKEPRQLGIEESFGMGDPACGQEENRQRNAYR